MPNQRSPDKVRLGGFVELGLYRAVVAMARREGFKHDKFGFAQQLLREALASREKSPRKRTPHRAGRRSSAAA